MRKLNYILCTILATGFPLSRIDEAYKIFENKEDGVIKIAIDNRY